MTKREYKSAMERFCKPRMASLWGQKSRVTPALVPVVFGDGKKWICLTPAATRPNYYVILGDSAWDLDNSGNNPFCEYLEQVYQAIETSFGNSDDEREEGETKRQWERRTNWPALSTGCGMSWGEF